MRAVSKSLLTALIVLSACSASKKAFKQAQEYEEAGLYVKAAEADLKALDEKPDYKEALVHLREMAPKAYEEMLKRATNLENAENWDRAVAEWQRLDKLLGRFHDRAVVLETINVRERLSNVRRKAAGYHYAAAEKFFAGRRWEDAAKAYLRADRHIGNYNQSFDKAVRSFMNGGDESMEQGDFNAAIRLYAEILKIAPNHAAANQKIAGARFRLGRMHFDEGNYRAALTEFERAEAYQPDYPDLNNWLNRAYENAVRYVGVFPFLNQSRVPVDGYFFASEILSRAAEADLRFADFLDYPGMMALVHDFELNRGNRLVEAELLRAARHEELDSIIWGKITDVEVRDESPRFEEHEYEKPVAAKDSLDNDIEVYETIFYREYSAVRNVRMEVELLIIDVESGKILERPRFREQLKDVARWVAYQGSIRDLPKEKQPLLDAPRDPRPVEVILEELVSKVAKRMNRDVVDFYE